MVHMAQLLNIKMPGSYEVTFPPQNPDMSGVDGPGKGSNQSGMSVEIIVSLDCTAVSTKRDILLH